MLEDRLKERETIVNKLEQDKAKLMVYAKNTLATFKEKYKTTVEVIHRRFSIIR